MGKDIFGKMVNSKWEIERRLVMSKNTGLGRKRIGSMSNKGMDKCDATSDGKQCGRQKKVSKGEHLHAKPEFTK